MRRRIIFMFVIGIIWVTLVLGVAVYGFWSDTRPTEYSHYNDYEVNEDYLYVTDNRRDDGFIYAIDTNSNVAHMYDARDFGNGGMFEAVCVREKGEHGEVYAVLRREVIYGRESIWTWQVLTFTRELALFEASDMITPVEGDVVTDIVAADDAIYVTYIEDDGSAAYTVAVDYGKLYDGAVMMASTKVDDNAVLSGVLGTKSVSAEMMGAATGSSDGGSSGGGSSAGNSDSEELGEKDYTTDTGAVIHKLPAVLARDADPGHFIVKARYDDGVINLLHDGDPDRSGYLGNENVRRFFAQKRFTPWQLIRVEIEIVRTALICIGVGLVVIFLIVLLVGSRSRNIYTILMTELLLLVMTVAGVYLTYRENEKSRSASSDEFAIYSVSSLYDDLMPLDRHDYNDPGFYNSEDYRILQRQLADFVGYRGNANVFYDVMIVDTSERNVLVSASGLNFRPVDEAYTSGIVPAVEDLMMGRETSSVPINIQGFPYRAVSVRGKNDYSPDHIIMGIVSRGAIGDDLMTVRRWYIILGILMFIGCSLVIVIFMYLQTLDIRRLAKGMSEIATGELYSEKGAFIMGKDLDTMWNALYEIDKRVRNINYTKFLIFESYFRFAPKAIEKILGKTSITEVKSGDKSLFPATLAMISSRDKGDLDPIDEKSVNIQLDVIAQYQEDEKGVLVSSDCSLSLMEMLFMAESRETANFGIYFMHVLENRLNSMKVNTFMLLHHDMYLYGVVGNSSQASAYLASQDADELARYIPWLRSLKLRLLITDSVKKREKVQGRLRNIGFINSQTTGNKIVLYEVIDAEYESLRLDKIEICDRFEEALSMFYNRDFYLARNTFSDILKVIPEDGISKWYIFECERLLDREDPGFDGALSL